MFGHYRITTLNLVWSGVQKQKQCLICAVHGNLCLAEKVAIAQFEGVGLLNKRTELLSKCRHRNKFIMGT